MKNIFLLFVTFALSLACQKEPLSPYVEIQDKAFEQRLIDLKFDSDNVINGKILRTDAEKVDSLAIANPRVACGNNCFDPPLITSLKGIEAFVNLRYLECSWNDIDSLDVSKNTKLEYLRCGGLNAPHSPDPLIYYNVKKNIFLPSSLKTLEAGYTSFSTFNSKDLINIEKIVLTGGVYSEINLSKCISLKAFTFYPNSKTTVCIKSLDQLTTQWTQSDKIVYKVCK